MSDSKKLPTIEVGDTVVFRTDLKEEYYGENSITKSMVPFLTEPQTVTAVSGYGKQFRIKSDNGLWAYTPEMVLAVIKPTKERVYTEREMFDFANSYADQVMAGMVKRAEQYYAEYIQPIIKAEDK